MKIKGAVFFLILFALFACHSPGIDGAAEKLLGVWETTEHRYKNCTFEIKKEEIIFSNEVSHRDVNRIKRIETLPKPEGVLYNIHYENKEKLKYTLSLVYSKRKTGEVIYFINQKNTLWTRATPSERKGVKG